MSQAMTASQAVAQLKKWHVPYKGTLGWRHRNRAGHGAWGQMHGIVNHHTAGATGERARDENRLLKRGRADLPGPLCNFSPARGGKVYLIGWGRANHAGSVRPSVKARFLTSAQPMKPDGTNGETVDGNAFLYGIEVQNDGGAEHYPLEQLLSLILLNAAICDFHDWDPTSVAQHYEITARKTDMAPVHFHGPHPAGPWLRAEVAVALKAGPGKYTRVGWRPIAPTPPAPLPDCNHQCPRHCTRPTALTGTSSP